MRYNGYTLHKISSKCGIFAEADANTLLKAGVTVEEIIASLFEAVVYQNLATLTRGNTPAPEILLLGGPNLFFKGLQEAWRHHLPKVWKERKIDMPKDVDPASMIVVPKDALYYAALGCVEIGRGEPPAVGVYLGFEKLQWWIEKASTKKRKSSVAAGSGKIPTISPISSRTIPSPVQAARNLNSKSPPRARTPTRILAAPSPCWTSRQRPHESFPRLRKPKSALSAACSSAAISARPPPKPSACRPKRNCFSRATRSAKAIRSKMRRRFSANSAKPSATAKSSASASPATAKIC